MESKEQNKKANHVVIVTSEAADASVKQFRIRPWVLWGAIIIFSVLIGAGLGYIIYEDEIWDSANARIDEYKKMITELETQLATKEEERTALEETHSEEIQNLELEMNELNNKLAVMSDTINQKVEEVNELTAQLDEMHIPTMLPLTGAASIEEKAEEEPICLFEASDGALVITTACGVVTEIMEEPEFGYKVSVDHGNGYVTIYRNKEEPKVKLGEELMSGATIFVIGKDNVKLGYQITNNGTYINPMDMMKIEG